MGRIDRTIWMIDRWYRTVCLLGVDSYYEIGGGVEMSVVV